MLLEHPSRPLLEGLWLGVGLGGNHVGPKSEPLSELTVLAESGVPGVENNAEPGLLLGVEIKLEGDFAVLDFLLRLLGGV